MLASNVFFVSRHLHVPPPAFQPVSAPPALVSFLSDSTPCSGPHSNKLYEPQHTISFMHVTAYDIFHARQRIRHLFLMWPPANNANTRRVQGVVHYVRRAMGHQVQVATMQHVLDMLWWVCRSFRCHFSQLIHVLGNA